MECAVVQVGDLPLVLPVPSHLVIPNSHLSEVCLNTDILGILSFLYTKEKKVKVERLIPLYKRIK